MPLAPHFTDHAAGDRGQPPVEAGGRRGRGTRPRRYPGRQRTGGAAPGRSRRADEDLRGDVLEALILDLSVPVSIEVTARDGVVTLTGTAVWHYQREAAESRTTGVPGVAGIDNAITLAQAPDARAAADGISGAFRRYAVLAADVLSAEAPSSGLVILSGTVSSWAAHDHTVAAVWFAPGATQVEDRIQVESSP